MQHAGHYAARCHCATVAAVVGPCAGLVGEGKCKADCILGWHFVCVCVGGGGGYAGHLAERASMLLVSKSLACSCSLPARTTPVVRAHNVQAILQPHVDHKLQLQQRRACAGFVVKGAAWAVAYGDITTVGTVLVMWFRDGRHVACIGATGTACTELLHGQFKLFSTCGMVSVLLTTAEAVLNGVEGVDTYGMATCVRSVQVPYPFQVPTPICLPSHLFRSCPHSLPPFKTQVPAGVKRKPLALVKKLRKAEMLFLLSHPPLTLATLFPSPQLFYPDFFLILSTNVLCM